MLKFCELKNDSQYWQFIKSSIHSQCYKDRYFLESPVSGVVKSAVGVQDVGKFSVFLELFVVVFTLCFLCYSNYNTTDTYQEPLLTTSGFSDVLT